ncbi:TPA: hypothetical protein NPO24_004229 [Klebsiella pneumoniae]|nr:hypothetical protein [Klebsiella pneumoniae]
MIKISYSYEITGKEGIQTDSFETRSTQEKNINEEVIGDLVQKLSINNIGWATERNERLSSLRVNSTWLLKAGVSNLRRDIPIDLEKYSKEN